MAIIGSGPAAALALNSLAQYGDRLQRAVLLDGADGNAPLQAIRKPVLIVQGFDESPLAVGTAEQMLWKMRNAGGNAALVSAGNGPAVGSPATRQAIRKAIAQFLQPLASGR
jgi:pimeloyl-ACP methyl ester carboxylesterase